MAEINKSRPAVSGAGAVVHFLGEYRSVFLTLAYILCLFLVLRR